LFEVEFYTRQGGTKPVQEFLDSLETKMRVKALNSLTLLEQSGNELREPYSKPIEKGIFELRIQFAGDISRIFYFFYMGKKIILTNGFIKKTQHTPRREIELAMKYKADYERRIRDE
jgi:phage-related protein